MCVCAHRRGMWLGFATTLCVAQFVRQREKNTVCAVKALSIYCVCFTILYVWVKELMWSWHDEYLLRKAKAAWRNWDLGFET